MLLMVWSGVVDGMVWCCGVVVLLMGCDVVVVVLMVWCSAAVNGGGIVNWKFNLVITELQIFMCFSGQWLLSFSNAWWKLCTDLLFP